MKNHLEFWGEHPIISNFWLIVHTIVSLSVAFATALTIVCLILKCRNNRTYRF